MRFNRKTGSINPAIATNLFNLFNLFNLINPRYPASTPLSVTKNLKPLKLLKPLETPETLQTLQSLQTLIPRFDSAQRDKKTETFETPVASSCLLAMTLKPLKLCKL